MSRALLVAVATLSGCASVEVKSDGPGALLAIQELTVTSQGLTEFRLKFTGKVEAPEALTLTQAIFELVVDEKVVKSGLEPLGIAVQPGTPAEFTFEQTSPYVASAEELKTFDSRGGSLLCALRGKLVLKGATKSFEIPFARSREVRTPRLPHAKFQEFEAGRYSEDEAGVTFHIGIANPNPFEVKMTSIKYKIVIAEKLVAESEIGKGDKVSASSTGVFDLEARINLETHGPEVKKLIKARTLPYIISGELSAELFSETFEFKGNLNLPPAK